MTIHRDDIPLTQPEAGRFLETMRAASGLSQLELIRRMNLASSTNLSRVENGIKNVSGRKMVACLRACGHEIIVNPDLLLPYDMDAILTMIFHEYAFSNKGKMTRTQVQQIYMIRHGSSMKWPSFLDILDQLDLKTEIPEHPGPWMKERRLERGLKTTDVYPDKEHSMRSCINHWENSVRIPLLHNMLAWMKELGILFIVKRKEMT